MLLRETEIYVLDCYWSDHCRHTTFETVLDEINIESELLLKRNTGRFDYYLKVRGELNRKDKPINTYGYGKVLLVNIMLVY